MHIGLYLDALDFKIPSHARFLATVFEGLVRKGMGRHTFTVLTWAAPGDVENDYPLKFVTLRKDRRFQELEIFLTRRLVSICLRLGRLLGFRDGKLVDALNKRWHFQPEYQKQLKELDIDLIWQVTGYELQSGLPFINTIFDMNHRIQPEYWTHSHFEYLERCWDSSRMASFLITGTQEGKKQIVSTYGIQESRVRVIPFPTPLLPDSKDIVAMDLGFQGPYVFYPARFWRQKNHVVALEALKVLRDKWNIRIKLVFSGKGSKDVPVDGDNFQYVMNYAQRLGVSDQVVYVGEVPLVELTALYKHALVLAYVSATGPDNLPPLEAMSVGCPAIVADVPGAREQYGDACLFYPTMDEHALAEQIKFLLENSTAREALIAKGFERAKKWTADDYAAEVVSLFDEFALIARAWGSSSAVYL